MSYVVTNRDRMAMIEIMIHAWNVNFKASRDRDVDAYTRRDGTYVEAIPAHTRWDVQAVNPVDKIYYTTDGDSIEEAVNKWFMKTGIPTEKPTTLYEEKAIESEIHIGEAQFYG